VDMIALSDSETVLADPTTLLVPFPMMGSALPSVGEELGWKVSTWIAPQSWL
jgi:hypothetical protein